MKKSLFYFFPILLLVGGYFYFTIWANKTLNETIKYQQKVENDKYGKQVKKLNINEAIEKDFYIVIDSNSSKTFFRVLGKTNDSQIAVQYGLDGKFLPNTKDFTNYHPKKSYNYFNFSFDQIVDWVEEIVNDDTKFEEKITLYSQDQLDGLVSNNTIIGYAKSIEESDKNPFLTGNLAWDLRFRYTMGDPIILLPIILILLILFWLAEKLKHVTILHNYPKVYYLITLLVIGLFSYVFASDICGPTYNGGSNWFRIAYIFLSYITAFFVFQYFKTTNQIEDFAKRQFLYFFAIIIIGIICEIVFRTAVNFVFYQYNPTEHPDGLSNSIFWIMTISFKNWLMIATAHFLHNLILYISSLLRKSRQLQSVTSTAKETAGALAHSEANVNAHFLYNSLHAIAALAPVAPDKTETLALSLSKYYRYTTNRNNEAMITIKDEIDALSAYLDVEKIRIGDKLSFTFDISEKVSSIYIPKFLLQPLVENAVKYGYNLEKGTTKISISFAKIGDETLKIYVCDSGKPFGDNMEIGNGIRNVKDILKRHFPDKHTISFVNQPEKCVEIVLKNINS